jgi:hypothetical protein
MNARFITSLTQAAYAPDGAGNYGLRTVPKVIAGQNSANAVTTDAVGGLSAGSAIVNYFALDQSDPRVHNWNLTVEKEILPNTLVRGSYVGNHSGALEQIDQFNLSTPAYIWYASTGQLVPTGALAAVATNAYDQTTYGALESWQNTGWGKPNGYEGIPDNYKPSVAPLIVYGQTTAPNAPAGTNMTGYYNSNTVWVPLSNGTMQRTTWSGLAPLRQQYVAGIWQWGLDASLVKNIAIHERIRFRLQCDFFNVLNHPGNPNSIGGTGILSTQSSGNSPRTLQLSGRLNW